MPKQGFKEKTQGMTVKEKLEYLWEYYNWVLLVAAFAAVVIAMVATGIVNSRVKPIYSGAAVNIQLTQEGDSYLTEQWESQLGARKNEKVDLFVTSFEDLQSASDAEVSSAAAMQVVLMIMAGQHDYVIMDEVALAFYQNHPVFTSLENMFSQELLGEFDGSIIYHKSEEIPFAIDITESPFVKDCVTAGERVYIAFPGNTGRTERNDDFLEYLMSWK